jgi:hypothetical protein
VVLEGELALSADRAFQAVDDHLPLLIRFRSHEAHGLGATKAGPAD